MDNHFSELEIEIEIESIVLGKISIFASEQGMSAEQYITRLITQYINENHSLLQQCDESKDDSIS